MRCLYCNGEMVKAKSTYTVNRKGYHLFLQEVPAYVCSQCGEKHFEEDEVTAIQKLIKQVEVGLQEVQSVKSV